MKYLDAIEARVKATTPGPWGVDGVSVIIPVDGKGKWPLIVSLQYDTEDGPAWTPNSEENAQFIAHARADIEALLRVVRAARKEVVRREGNPQSKIFRQSVMIHGGIQHRAVAACELCEALAVLDAGVEIET